MTSMQNCAKGLLICVQCSGACPVCCVNTLKVYDCIPYKLKEQEKAASEMLCSHQPFAEKTIPSSCTTETGSRMEQKKPLSRSLTKLVSIPNTETDGARARTGLIKLEHLIFDILNFYNSIARQVGNFFNIVPKISVFLFSQPVIVSQYLVVYPRARTFI